MTPVIHVIPVIDVVDVNVVSFVPSARPVFRPWINDTEPEAAVLESGVSTDDQEWGAVNAKPVSTAKMRTEAVFRNAVAPVTAAFAPATMFMLPILCAMALPNISRIGVLFVPDCLAHVFRPIRLPVMWLLPLRPILVCPLLLVRALFAPLLRPVRRVSVRVLLRRRASVFLLMLVSLLLLGTSLPSVLMALRCVGRSSCSQK
jgi:hypothetical protein